MSRKGTLREARRKDVEFMIRKGVDHCAKLEDGIQHTAKRPTSVS